MDPLETTLAAIEPADAGTRARAVERLEQLTMPHWAMGRLLDLAADLAGMTASLAPPVRRRAVVVMAADHGVTSQGVSQYPADVTPQMVRNFAAGGAAINAMARTAASDLVVVDMGVDGDLADLVQSGAVLDHRIAAGTADLSLGPAMSPEQARACVEAGIAVAADLASTNDLLGTGDIGIGNTTPSAAIAACISGLPADQVTGRGIGIDDARWAQKVATVQRALEVNAPDPTDGLDVLTKVGGFEIGGLAGLILGAAAHRRPVIIDGYISTAAALIATLLSPAAADYVILAHRSAESGHVAMCDHLGRQPLLDLDLRLGEGTGAALAMPLVEAAARLLTEVATFAEAAVSGEDG
ncbi:MAG: nicotinate-nucleotide--dimethylbenzimidazole phosphoribosyltransferase [Candidatus Latescibacteria bacterium]|nr:nicotinate-nucleotide--dimethylbenzimidazole phosphoribosyltransferase [Candidatus Latescibacterota bacterium]